MAIETIITPKPASPSREAFTKQGSNRPRYAQKKKDAKKKKDSDRGYDERPSQSTSIIVTKKSPYLV